MSTLAAFLAAQRHSHRWEPMGTVTILLIEVELEHCCCGAVREVQRPETD